MSFRVTITPEIAPPADFMSVEETLIKRGSPDWLAVLIWRFLEASLALLFWKASVKSLINGAGRESNEGGVGSASARESSILASSEKAVICKWESTAMIPEKRHRSNSSGRLVERLPAEHSIASSAVDVTIKAAFAILESPDYLRSLADEPNREKPLSVA